MTVPVLKRSKAVSIAVRVGVFVLLAFIGLNIFFAVLYGVAGTFAAAVMGTFGAAATANAVGLRIFERAKLPAVGLGWAHGGGRNLMLGVAGGVAAALLTLVPPLAAGVATLVPDPQQPASASGFLFMTVMLVFGAVGEELLFRGYGFQLLAVHAGRFATILPTAILFGLAHGANENFSRLGLINTIGFGVVLGYACVRSGDLWLPIGLHFGWNWVLPLFGANLSGFTMGVTGRTMQWNAGPLWSGGGYGPEASILTSAVIVLLMVYLAKAPVAEQELALAQTVTEA